LDESLNLKHSHPFLPNLHPDISDEMLKSISASSTEDLFQDIPSSLRIGSLNIPKSRTENEVERYFDDILSIESVGVYKPDSRVYEMPIKKYNCAPENICFMSSNTWDISGGGVFGYNAVWVNRFNKVFDKLSYKPKFVINNLKELLKII